MLTLLSQCNILRPLPAIAPDQYVVEADGDELPCESGARATRLVTKNPLKCMLIPATAWMHIGVAYDILLLCSQPGCFSKQVTIPQL